MEYFEKSGLKLNKYINETWKFKKSLFKMDRALLFLKVLNLFPKYNKIGAFIW
jgi:hypothetical protein